MNIEIEISMPVNNKTKNNKNKNKNNNNGNNFGKKYRRGKRYARKEEEARLEKLKKTQRKREKANYDTWRLSEMPDEKDSRLEDMHYANFLGDKYGDNGSRYNDSTVNLKFCDKMREDIEDDPKEEEEYAFEEMYEYAIQMKFLNDKGFTEDTSNTIINYI
jgi:hypothetical protein